MFSDFSQAEREQAAERTSQSFRILDFLSELEKLLQGNGTITESEICGDNDLHLFCRLSSRPELVLHIQAYPGFSSDQLICFWGRLMDREEMLILREETNVSHGYEHRAVRYHMPSLPMHESYSWDASIIVQKIDKDLRTLPTDLTERS